MNGGEKYEIKEGEVDELEFIHDKETIIRQQYQIKVLENDKKDLAEKIEELTATSTPSVSSTYTDIDNANASSTSNSESYASESDKTDITEEFFDDSEKE